MKIILVVGPAFTTTVGALYQNRCGTSILAYCDAHNVGLTSFKMRAAGELEPCGSEFLARDCIVVGHINSQVEYR